MVQDFKYHYAKSRAKILLTRPLFHLDSRYIIGAKYLMKQDSQQSIYRTGIAPGNRVVDYINTHLAEICHSTPSQP